MPSDLQVVAQYAKSRRDAPSEVYNAACRLLNGASQAPVDESALVIVPELERLRSELAEATRAFIGQRRNAYGYQCPALRALGYLEKDAESHGGGRNPQTQGASEAQEAREAQEASQ